MKVLLILNDGMRPDCIKDHKLTKYFCEHGTYSLKAQTAWPSVTLPCHVSLFYGVAPERHGTTDNVYSPQVRPVPGITEVLARKGFKSAMFYDWEELRDCSRPGCLVISEYRSGGTYGYENTAKISAARVLQEKDPDFTFLYLGLPDTVGHGRGWCGKEYIESLNYTCDIVYDLVQKLQDEYTIIFTADHGGHGYTHGTKMPEDMTIPLFFLGKDFKAGRENNDMTIYDVAPTIANLFGADIPEEWIGKVIH